MAARRKYNWEGLFERPYTELVRGRDYQCSQAIMWQTIRNEAGRRKIKVRVTDTHDGITVEVLSAIPHTNQTAVAGQSEPPALATTG